MKCALCSNTIPKTRKRSAKYCSDECYYESKKDRSSRRYALISAAIVEIKKNESILGYMYSVGSMNKPINADDLSSYQFNFGLSTGEHFDKQKGPCKVVGKYAYHINPDKSLIVWKLK